MILWAVVLPLPLLLIAVCALRGVRVATLGPLPASLLSSGLISAADWPAVLHSTGRLRSARATGAFVGFLAFAVPIVVFRRSLEINFMAILAGAVLGVVVGQWWVNRIPRTGLRSAPLVRRRLVDLVGPLPMVLLGLTGALAVLGDIAWIALRPGGSNVHHLSNGYTCLTPVVSSVQHHLLAWTVIAPVLLISLGGALTIVRRAVDPTIPATADFALRAAGARTALGCGILFVGGHATATYAEMSSFTSSFDCVQPRPWWYDAVGPAIVLMLYMLCWCLAVYVFAPARRPKPLAVSPAPQVVAVS